MSKLNRVYSLAMSFKDKYPITIAFRIKKHCDIIEKHLNPGEEVRYVFVGQKNEKIYEIFNSYVVVLTNKRILLGRKRLIFGYFFNAITPDMFNDMQVKAGIFWGKIIIDTVTEEVRLSNISRNALDEIETEVTEYMMEEKKKYGKKDLHNK
ncbi:MAG: PH domain-containing protein [Bacilli bacterium]|nr:PH domain-containing protein [Bacilli bacterium]